MRIFLFFILVNVFVACNSSADSDITPPNNTDIPTDPTTPPNTADASSVINDTFLGEPIVVYGDPEKQIIVSFSRRLSNGVVIEANEPETQTGNNLFEDNRGNSYNIFGKVVSGPNTGQQLKQINSLNTYWFSIASTIPGTAIYSEQSISAPPHDLNDNQWLVPTNYIFQGSSLDFIPSIDQPQFDVFQQRDLIEEYPHLRREELVTVIEDGSSYKIYPHSILSYHEIVNDQLSDGTAFSLLFCPLIGSSVVWERENTTYGVSGLLYNSDLIAFDRNNGSLFMQLTGQCINGPELGDQKKKIVSADIEWGALATIFPNESLSVLSTDTDQDYDYSVFPYSGYQDNPDFIFFPLAFEDTRLPNKELVHTVISPNVNHAKVYRFSHFQ